MKKTYKHRYKLNCLCYHADGKCHALRYQGEGGMGLGAWLMGVLEPL